jgi:hypothetical protein
MVTIAALTAVVITIGIVVTIIAIYDAIKTAVWMKEENEFE